MSAEEDLNRILAEIMARYDGVPGVAREDVLFLVRVVRSLVDEATISAHELLREHTEDLLRSYRNN